jgi:hypothetical protein
VTHKKEGKREKRREKGGKNSKNFVASVAGSSLTAQVLWGLPLQRLFSVCSGRRGQHPQLCSSGDTTAKRAKKEAESHQASYTRPREGKWCIMP